MPVIQVITLQSFNSIRRQWWPWTELALGSRYLPGASPINFRLELPLHISSLVFSIQQAYCCYCCCHYTTTTATTFDFRSTILCSRDHSRLGWSRNLDLLCPGFTDVGCVWYKCGGRGLTSFLSHFLFFSYAVFLTSGFAVLLWHSSLDSNGQWCRRNVQNQEEFLFRMWGP